MGEWAKRRMGEAGLQMFPKLVGRKTVRRKTRGAEDYSSAPVLSHAVRLASPVRRFAYSPIRPFAPYTVFPNS
jgi:hypothetical protein